MRTIRTVAELRAALAGPRRSGRVIGLVPTMGAFHEGHLSLMRRAREDCDEVVVSLFVNPAQFNETADLDTYPCDQARDRALARQVGVDYLFAPSAEEVYPRNFATKVSVAGVTETLEGEHRGRGHFDGVTTVVIKLLNMVSSDVAYFGQKDAQQALVIRRMVENLNIPVRVEICPTVREPDGLAMSSRNALLSPADRTRAAALYRALRALDAAVAAGDRDPASVRAVALEELSYAEIEPDYLEVVSTDTLAPVQRIEGDVLVLVAARVGPARLIDNQILTIDREVATPIGASTVA
jgi:pantoate--beta-alanine ligase